jgi:hypothetical protein
VLTHEKERTVGKSFLVHSGESKSSGSRLFEADESTVFGLVTLDVGGLNFSVSSKHCGKLSIISASGESLHEEVSELSFSSTTLSSLVLGLMQEHFEVFTSEHELVLLKVKNFLSHICGLEQDVTKTAAFAVGEGLDLSRADITEGLEELMEFFLSNFLSQVAYQEIGVSIELLVTLLETDTEELSIQFEVVHLVSSLLRFFLNSEGDESIVQGLLGEVVDTDGRADGAQTLGLEKLLQLEVEEVRRQVSDVNCWWALFLLLRSIATAILLVNDALEHLLHSSVSLGSTTHAHLLRASALNLVSSGARVHLLVLHVLVRREVAHGIVVNK